MLKKYAYFLQTEDALQELQCFLLAFVKNLHLNKLTSSTNGAIISYINKTIYHHYIALSKGNRHKIPTVSIEDKSDFDSLQFDSNFGESDTYSNLLLMDLQRALSTEEYHVIYDHYFRQCKQILLKRLPVLVLLGYGPQCTAGLVGLLSCMLPV